MMIQIEDSTTQKFLNTIVEEYLDEVVGKYDSSLVDQLSGRIVDIANSHGAKSIYEIDFSYALNEAMREIS